MPLKRDLHPASRKKRKNGKDKEGVPTSLSLCVNKKSGDIFLKLINNKTLEVIKEIPPQELLDIKDRLNEMISLLFNARKI